MTPPTCKFCRDRLSALMDRELGPEELDAVREHLDGCDDCRRDLARLLCADAEASLPAVPATPEGLWERIEGALSFSDVTTEPVLPAGADILTPKEAAAFLRLTGDELEAELEHLPHFQIGSHLRFRKTALEVWMASQESSPSTAEHGFQMKEAAGGNVVDFAAAKARLSRYGRR